jgi:biopolymer transport protein ExbB/TolQ
LIEGEFMSGFFEFLKTEFLHALPILLCGAFGAAIIFERIKALFVQYPIQDTAGFFDKLTELVMSGKMADAVQFCDRYQGKPVAQIAKTGLLRAHQPEHLLEHGLELEMSKATQLVQRRTSFLSTIANVATLFGLFGTVAGLIASFEAVAHADAQQKSALLSAGISTAMNATMLGLGVAIPCLLAYSFLMNRTNRLIGDIEQATVQVADILKQRYYAVEQNIRKNGHEVASLDHEVEVKKPHLRRVV